MTKFQRKEKLIYQTILLFHAIAENNAQQVVNVLTGSSCTLLCETSNENGGNEGGIRLNILIVVEKI